MIAFLNEIFKMPSSCFLTYFLFTPLILISFLHSDGGALQREIRWSVGWGHVRVLLTDGKCGFEVPGADEGI